MKTFFRVCNLQTEQGLWYNFDGSFSGLIHKEFDFCQNSQLKMDFDESLVGWLSAVENVEDLWQWFSKEDIKRLEENGWFITEYETVDYRFYNRFSHYVISQKNSTVKKVHKLESFL